MRSWAGHRLSLGGGGLRGERAVHPSICRPGHTAWGALALSLQSLTSPSLKGAGEGPVGGAGQGQGQRKAGVSLGQRGVCARPLSCMLSCISL